MKTSAVWPLSLGLPVPSALTARFALGLGLPLLLPHRAPNMLHPCLHLPTPCHLTTCIPQVCTPFPNSDHPSKILVWPPRPAALSASVSGRPPTCHLSPLQLHLRPDVCPAGLERLRRGLLLSVPIYPHSTELHSDGHAKFPVKRNASF